MKKRILVYGGKENSNALAAFMEELSYYLLNFGDVVLITGGFYRKANKQETSIDKYVLSGAARYAIENEKKTEELIEAWLPDPKKENDEEKIKRFEQKDGAFIITLLGSTAQKRRMEMVNGVDAVITMCGKKYTQLVLDLSFAINKPTYPLPFGDKKFSSAKAWEENKAEIIERFDLKPGFVHKLEKTNIETLPENNRYKLIKSIAKQVYAGMERKCLILMHINEKKSEKFYNDIIKPAVQEAGYIPNRIDQGLNEGEIFKTFEQDLENSDAILADITDSNPNVMYELGQAHAKGFSTILLRRKKVDSDPTEKVPFYLQSHTIIDDNAEEPEGKNNLKNLIVEYLVKKWNDSKKLKIQ